MAMFSLRTAFTPAATAASFALSGMSGWFLTQSRILFATSTLLMISVFARTTAATASLNRLAAVLRFPTTACRSAIRVSRELPAALAPCPAQMPIPPKILACSCLAESACLSTVFETVTNELPHARRMSSSTSGHAGDSVKPYGSAGRAIPMNQLLTALQAS